MSLYPDSARQQTGPALQDALDHYQRHDFQAARAAGARIRTTDLVASHAITQTAELYLRNATASTGPTGRSVSAPLTLPGGYPQPPPPVPPFHQQPDPSSYSTAGRAVAIYYTGPNPPPPHGSGHAPHPQHPLETSRGDHSLLAVSQQSPRRSASPVIADQLDLDVDQLRISLRRTQTDFEALERKYDALCREAAGDRSRADQEVAVRRELDDLLVARNRERADLNARLEEERVLRERAEKLTRDLQNQLEEERARRLQAERDIANLQHALGEEKNEAAAQLQRAREREQLLERQLAEVQHEAQQKVDRMRDQLDSEAGRLHSEAARQKADELNQLRDALNDELAQRLAQERERFLEQLHAEQRRAAELQHQLGLLERQLADQQALHDRERQKLEIWRREATRFRETTDAISEGGSQQGDFAPPSHHHHHHSGGGGHPHHAPYAGAGTRSASASAGHHRDAAGGYGGASNSYSNPSPSPASGRRSPAAYDLPSRSDRHPLDVSPPPTYQSNAAAPQPSPAKGVAPPPSPPRSLDPLTAPPAGGRGNSSTRAWATAPAPAAERDPAASRMRIVDHDAHALSTSSAGAIRSPQPGAGGASFVKKR